MGSSDNSGDKSKVRPHEPALRHQPCLRTNVLCLGTEGQPSFFFLIRKEETNFSQHSRTIIAIVTARSGTSTRGMNRAGRAAEAETKIKRSWSPCDYPSILRARYVFHGGHYSSKLFLNDSAWSRLRQNFLNETWVYSWTYEWIQWNSVIWIHYLIHINHISVWYQSYHVTIMIIVIIIGTIHWIDLTQFLYFILYFYINNCWSSSPLLLLGLCLR